MPYGTHKLLGAASTAAAWRDWRAIQSWCDQNGHSELAAQHASKEGVGHKTVDKRIEKLRVALGAPAGAWENVLDGLTQAQHEQQQPQPEPSPTQPLAEEQTYSQRVYQAYRDLAEQYQSPNVRIDALHSRLGGSLRDLHRWLRQACRDHLAVPSAGEPALADHAARQSALCLPGEADRATGKPQSFLLIKLIDPPTMTQDQHPQQPEDSDPFGAEGLTAEQKLLNVAKGVLKATELKRKQVLGRSDTYVGSLDQIALAARHTWPRTSPPTSSSDSSPPGSSTSTTWVRALRLVARGGTIGGVRSPHRKDHSAQGR
jgi:hypothetical protein